MNHSPRILLLYATAGDGHRRAAEAVADQLRSRGAHVALLDAVPYTHPIFRAIYVGGGLNLIIRLPRLYHAAYRLTDRSSIDRVLRGPRQHAQQLSTRSLLHAITTFQPDAIVCTHFLPAELCAGWRQSNRLTVPVYTVVTDFEPHRMWQHRGLDGYFVATAEAADRLVSDGIDRSIVQVTGIPIQSEFASLNDRATAKTRLQIDLDRSLLLLMGGGLGVGGIDHLARSLVQRPIDSQIAFITGHNRTLRRRLRQQSPDWIVRGYINNMPDWLAAADVVISKAGGLAASELMAAGVPTIIPPSLRGHETSNAQYFSACGAAIMADSIPNAIDQAAALLQDRSLQHQMRSAAQRFARPNAAEDVADYVLRGACDSPRSVAERGCVSPNGTRTTHHAIYE
jgi:processive 1,2-diacylglycerol beta-glucosyltransferase